MKMKMSSKICLASLISAATLTGFTSCGNEAKEKTIKFYHTVNNTTQIEYLNGAKANFEAKNPGWTVDLHFVEGSYAGVQKEIKFDFMTGDQPDLAYCYPDHVTTYFEYQQVYDISQIMTEEEKKAFVPTYLEACKAKNYGGYKTYGFSEDSIVSVPFTKSTEVLFYNLEVKKYFDEKYSWTGTNGFAEKCSTWDGVFELAREWKEHSKKTDDKGKVHSSTAFAYDSAENNFITWAQQLGNGYTSVEDDNHYLFNNDDNAKMLAKINEIYNEGIYTNAKIYGGYASNLFTQAKNKDEYKAAEAAAFVVGSSAGASYYNYEYKVGDKKMYEKIGGVLPLPGFEVDGKVHNECISQGPDLVMLKTPKYKNDTERKQKTWEFAKELLTPDFQSKFCMATGYNPSIEATFEVDAYKTFLAMASKNIKAESASIAKELSEQENRFFTSPAFEGSSDARTQVGAALNAAIAKKCNTEEERIQLARKELQEAYSSLNH